MIREGTTRRRFLAFALVTLAHLGIIVANLRPSSAVRTTLDEHGSPLLLLYLPPPVRDSVSTALPTIQGRLRLQAPAHIVAPALPGDPSAADTASDSLTSDRGIDWSEQQAQVARTQSESILKELKRSCHEAELRGEVKAECHKYKKPEAWSPEPSRFGVAGGLPFVRLGKRCVLGLGFFGCAIGSLPDADGHALDDMHDPDRAHSSVPDPSE